MCLALEWEGPEVLGVLAVRVSENVEGLDHHREQAEEHDEEGELEPDLGGVDILVGRVRDVVLEAGDGPLSPDGVLGAEPEEAIFGWRNGGA